MSSLLSGLVIAGLVFAEDAPLTAGDLRRSGTIRLDVSCRPELKSDFETALAMLHSFFYVEARRRFEDLAKRDPTCAMAWWGVAMTWYHPLWAPPTPEEMTRGVEAIEKAKQLGGATELERGLIGAVDAFFRSQDEPLDPNDPVAMSCHGPRAHGARAGAFASAFEALHQQFPDNLEVSVFYSLGLLGTAPPTDKHYRNQLQATAILEPLFEQNPDHPGIAHYIIHSYDYPTMAARAIVAARQYDDIAPWVPHALHMPTHIYTRLGMWADSIKGNLASSAAARDYAKRFYNGATIADDLHALDYLMFAYLQTAQEERASDVVQHLRGIESVDPSNGFASAYALGAIPARYVLEGRHWERAARLEVPFPEFLAAFPYAVAHIEFARAVGAARAGDLARSRAAIVRLDALRESMTEPKFQWWTGQIEIQQLAARGWLSRAQREDADALRLLRESAELEDRSGTHPVTPGQILPAREQLGDLLVELGRPSEAVAEYQRSLESFPNRFNGHYGAARAAELAGDRAEAENHYRKVVQMAGSGDGRSKELAAARSFLAASTGSPR